MTRIGAATQNRFCVMNPANQPRFSIKTVSKLAGIPTDTLRNWERRYHFLKPCRNDKGARLYSEQDLQLIIRFHTQVKRGERAVDVAERIRKGEILPEIEAPDQRLPSELRQLIQDFGDALMGLRLDEADHLHANLQVSLPFRQRLDLVYGPLLARIGGGSFEGNFASVWIRQVLSGFLASSQPFGAGKQSRAVCATLPGELHEAGMLMIAAHLKFCGWKVYYLGSSIPLPEIARCAELADPTAIFLSASDPGLLERELAAIRELPRPTLVGGRAVQAGGVQESGSDSVHLVRQSGERAVNEVFRKLGR
jgi:DNA-binding transcriptional MerR regulator